MLCSYVLWFIAGYLRFGTTCSFFPPGQAVTTEYETRPKDELSSCFGLRILQHILRMSCQAVYIPAAFSSLGQHMYSIAYNDVFYICIYTNNSPVTGLVKPRGFQELKVPRLHDNGTGWW